MLLLDQTRWRGPKPRRGGIGRWKQEREWPVAGPPAHADERESETRREPGWAKIESKREIFVSFSFFFS